MNTVPKESRKWFLLIALCMLAGVILTRGYALDHNLMGHPDEHVFYGSTELLMNDILYGEDYEPIKAYPEGTYVFHLPFHLMGQIIDLDDDYAASVSKWGRISSVFYYSLGCVMGLWLVVSALHGRKAGAVIYALSVTFGLFQIELSRYGTFDPISFFVLTGTLVLVTQYLRKGKLVFLLAAAFAVGVAAAGKYPLFYYFLLPFAAMLLQKKPRKESFLLLCAMGFCTIAGFVLFSPSVIKSPLFFVSASLGGLDGYVSGGNPEGYSTVIESVFSVLVYQLLYSDLPLAPVFAVLCVIRLHRGGEKNAEKLFFAYVLPAVILVFLCYNVLLTTFYMRTLFPYYCLSLLYAAAGLGALCTARGVKMLTIVLCALMAVRGGMLVFILGDDDYESQAAARLLADVEAEQIHEVVDYGIYFTSPALKKALSDYELERVGITDMYEGRERSIEQGQLFITCSLDHGMAKKCVFEPNKEEIINLLDVWESFKEENEQYYIGRVYPEYYYKLFGFWVHGSTATNYEFPNTYVYLNPAQ